MASGHCNCGAVAFQVDAELTDIYVCHCSICRRATGSHGISVIVVPNEVFQWIQGEEAVSTWKKPDADWQIWFCRICGSPVPGANDDSTMYFPASLISEGDESLRVAHHIWVDSKASWDEIGDGGKQHRQAFMG